MKTTAIFGPPGTGKTTTMMTLVQECIAEGYKASEIMYLSFTKAAAGEVLRRMKLKRSENVSTIHSACYRLLSLGGASVVNFYKLKEFGAKVGIPFRGQSDDAAETMELGDQYLQIMSLARNRGHDLEEEYVDSDRPGDPANFQYFCESYESWKESNGLIDFTDMLGMYREDPRDHGCKVIFVDESQDLSWLQWEVIERFVQRVGVERVYFAGDDDQAIFEWAGADPHGMVAFGERYDASQIILGQSYRLPDEIWNIATTISKRIEHRVDKQFAPRDEAGQTLYEPLFDASQQKEGFILCRSHMIKQAVEKLLIVARTPFRSEGGGLPGPFDCKAAKAIRAWSKYKESGHLSTDGYEAMVGAAIDRVRADLVAGDRQSILNEDPMRVFKIPPVFREYFRDVDINSDPQLTTMTIHASKGREADEVTVITDWPPRVEAGFFSNPDAEHRTWYVATSRAKETLRLTTLGEAGYDI